MNKHTYDQPVLLACFAHPDDEAFSTGGTIARYAAAGVHVVLVCSTRGEAGEISDPSLATPETLGQVREDELRCAAENMGIAELVFLDYCDSGMHGSPQNDDPRAYINASDEEVVAKLVEVIRRVKPHVVITFEPFGGYGHPDHIAIHNHTVAAFKIAADTGEYQGLGEPWQPERLFYTVIPRAFFERMRQEMEKLGDDTTGFDDSEQDIRGWPDGKINLVIDASSTVAEKWEALECHRTQFGPGNLFRRIPEEAAKEMMGDEYFYLAWPEVEPGNQLRGFFSGLENFSID